MEASPPPKPEFLSPANASAFQEVTVAAAYQHRPQYPSEVFDILLSLIPDPPGRVLDAGSGTGFLARRLASRVDHVDAVDVSAAMIAQGRSLPGGNSPNLTWILGTAEQAELHPLYDLITAGDSLHWMDWWVVMPRFCELLGPDGYLAILTVDAVPAAWQEEMRVIRQRFSTVRNYQEYDLPQELEDRHLFRRAGSARTQPVSVSQRFDEYIESFHGRASFSRERMTSEAASALDREVRELVSRHSGDLVTLQIVAEIVWGRPLGAKAVESTDSST